MSLVPIVVEVVIEVVDLGFRWVRLLNFIMISRVEVVVEI